MCFPSITAVLVDDDESNDNEENEGEDDDERRGKKKIGAKKAAKIAMKEQARQEREVGYCLGNNICTVPNCAFLCIIQSAFLVEINYIQILHACLAYTATACRTRGPRSDT